jgi:hypothetical protein
MAWHIFRKDLRLLWGAALAVAAIQLVVAALRARSGLFQEPRQLYTLAIYLGLVWRAGVVILCVNLMHQDAVPGDRQDWLIRPIGRGQLILGKLLFVLFAVQAPILIVNLFEGLTNGFGFTASLAAAAARNVSILCFFSIPALAIGAATRTLTETFLIVVAGLIASAAIFFSLGILTGQPPPLAATGLTWLLPATWQLVAIVFGAFVVAIQFFQRKTILARCLIGAGFLVVNFAFFLPWPPAFAIQQLLSTEPGASAPIALTFNPQLGPFVPPPGAAPTPGQGWYLPLRVVGIPTDSIVLMDHAQIRITDIDGREIYAGTPNLSVDGKSSLQDARFEVRRAENGPSTQDSYQRIFVPASVYEKLRDQTVNVSIDYSLTLLHASAKLTLPTSSAPTQFGTLGRCATRIDSDGDEVQVSCMNLAPSPECFTAFLEHPSSGLRNPETHHCAPDYSPIHFSMSPTVPSRFAGEAPFFDRSGLTRYPVDGTKLADARVVIETYEARDHFTRKLDIPNVQLSRFAGY